MASIAASRIHSAPPRRDSVVRVYALRDSSVHFIAELGLTDRADDAGQVPEKAPAGSGEPGDILLAFLSNGNICGIATLAADAPRQVQFESDVDDDEEDGEDQQHIKYDAEDDDGDSKEEDEGEEYESEDDDDDDDDDSEEEGERRIVDRARLVPQPRDLRHPQPRPLASQRCREVYQVQFESDVDDKEEEEDGKDQQHIKYDAEDDDDDNKEEDEGEEYESEDDDDDDSEEEEEEESEVEDDDDDDSEEEGEQQQHKLDLCVPNVSSNDKDDNNEWKEEDGCEDVDDDGWIDWEDDAEKQEQKSEPTYSLKIRVWPSYGYANIVLFDGKSWMSTTSFTFTWLSSAEAEIMAEKLADISQHDMKLDASNAVLLRIQYEGVLVNSWAVQMFVQHKLSPSIYDFIDQKLLGKGAYCNVRLCTSRYDKKDYAIKIIKIEKYDPSEPREVGILSSLRSDHVVKFVQAWTETHIFVEYEECLDYEDDSRESVEGPIDMQQPKYVLIHMELCSGSLEDYLSTGSRKIDSETLRIFKEIVRGLQYIHGENVIHRDLKPANIFMGKDGRVKLGDFGQSCVRPVHAGSFNGTPYLGTPYYEAPELLKGKNISEKVDIHSLGAIYLELYNLFTTVLERTITMKKIKNGDSSSTDFEGDLLLYKKMIAFDPFERPSVDDLVDYVSKL